MSAELIELSNALVRATDRAAASVVAVHVEARGSSSGVIWRPGVIVTAVSERQTWSGSYLVPYVRLDVGLQPTAVGGAVVELREPLTPREHEVLQMISAGLGNKEIAERLSISDHTVKIHAASILGKLGASSRTRFHWNSSRSRASLGHP
jgi:DNA-binding NarL/FixJ family response regulator